MEIGITLGQEEGALQVVRLYISDRNWVTAHRVGYHCIAASFDLRLPRSHF